MVENIETRGNYWKIQEGFENHLSTPILNQHKKMCARPLIFMHNLTISHYRFDLNRNPLGKKQQVETSTVKMICSECANISFSSANVQCISLTSFIFEALHLQSMFLQTQVIFSAVIEIFNLFLFFGATKINENSSEIPRSAQKNNIQKWENLLLKRKPFWKRKGEKQERANVI